MTTDILEEQPPDTPPTKKMKWYWHILLFLFTIWGFGGLRVLCFQDIPLLIFLVSVNVLIALRVSQWLGFPLKSWSGRLLQFLWTLGVIVWILLLLFFVIPPFAISPETTYLMEPRAKEFYGIDYRAAIEQQLDPGVPPEENGLRLLTETFGRPFFGKAFEDQHWNRLCEYLGLPTDIEPTLTYTDWEEYRTTLEPEEQEIVNAMRKESAHILLSEEAMPIVRQWLDENTPAIELIVSAIQMPVLYAPPMFGEDLSKTVLVNDNIGRSMVRSLGIRVRYCFATGDIEAAWDDVLAMYRLGEQHRQSVWDMGSAFTNSAILGSASAFAEAVLLHSDWNSEEVLRRYEVIAPFLQPFRENEIRFVLRNRRLEILDFVQYVPSSREEMLAKNWQDWWKQKQAVYFRRGYAMVEVNRQCDEWEQRFFDGLPEKEKEFMGMYDICKIVAWYGTLTSIPVVVGQGMSALLIYTGEALRTLPESGQAHVSLTHLVFALEAYRRDNGGYPDTLDALQEHYIAEIPLDPFSGEAFRYVKEGENYLLYSVGPNGVDDEGRSHNDKPKGDDIRRRYGNAATD